MIYILYRLQKDSSCKSAYFKLRFWRTRYFWLPALTFMGVAFMGEAFMGEALLANDFPHRFNLGSIPSPEEISVLDTAIRPDGRGLPPGSGDSAQGLIVYQQQCQACHSEGGKGGLFDPLVSTQPSVIFAFNEAGARPTPTIGNYWPYATTLFDYIRRAMPYNAPGSLSNNQIYAVSAYLLHANGIIPETLTLNASNLAGITMPAFGHFVPDDRLSTPSVK